MNTYIAWAAIYILWQMCWRTGRPAGAVGSGISTSKVGQGEVILPITVLQKEADRRRLKLPDTVKQIFEEGNEHFLNQRYVKAMESYKKLCDWSDKDNKHIDWRTLSDTIQHNYQIIWARWQNQIAGGAAPGAK